MEDSWIFGNNEIYVSSVTNGIDFMTATLEELNEFVNKLVKLKAKLGPTLINQNKISGIGVAWGSEILHRAGLRPDEPANSQDLSNLAIVMIEVREEIKMIYENELEQQQMDVKKFIEDWFENLYRIRNMKIYKIGRKINISGRNWWI